MKNKLRGLRNTYGFTQAMMAEKVGISPSNYNQKEVGKLEFNRSEMQKITEILKGHDPTITMDTIFMEK